MTPQPTPSHPRFSDRGLFRFCPGCAGVLARREIHGLVRPHCPACGFVQWRNPGVGVAGLVTENEVVRLLGVQAVRAGLESPDWEPAPEDNRLLLVRRRASRHPGWCLPCGWVEHDEEIREALRREMSEETGLQARVGAIFAVHSNFHDPDHQSVGVWFRCRPEGGVLRPGDDADAICFVRPDQVTIPLAFPTDRLVLEDFATQSRFS